MSTVMENILIRSLTNIHIGVGVVMVDAYEEGE
jgi:hypothetical protein